MAVVARGSVRDRPFARTIYAVGARRFSGDMVVTEAGTPYTVTWQDGAVVAAASAAPADSLARIALTEGLVTTTQLSEVLRRAAAGRPLLELLVEVARLRPEQVLRVKRRALAQCAMRIFALPGATFVLDSAASRPADAEVAPLHVCWLMYQGLAAHYPEERLGRELAAVLEARFQLAEGARLEVFGFEAALQPCLGALGRAPVSVDELARAAPAVSRKAVLAMLYALVASDAAIVVGRAPAAMPAPAEAPAATPARPAPARPAPARHAPGPRRAPDPARAAEIRELMAAWLARLDGGADHYQLLGVARDAEADDLRGAYHALARKLHPDRLRAVGLGDGTADAQRLFASINQAYAVLGSPGRRAGYDALLRSGRDEAAERDAEAMAARVLTAEQCFARGEQALRRNQPGAAVIELERALELNPDEAEYHANLAWARWCAAGDKDVVLAQVKHGLSRALALAPRCVSALFYRGQVASMVDELEVALDCFRKVLELEPDHHEAALQVRLLQGRLSRSATRKRGSLLDALKRW